MINQHENSVTNLPHNGRVIDILAQKAQVSPITYLKGRMIMKNAPEEMKDKLRKGAVRIDKIYRQLQKQQKRQELINAVPILDSNKDNIKLLHGDLRNQKTLFLTIP